ncbi:MAG: hypothetical protein HY343_02510 [Lentisphaerae bacterium]|nr:hypothetical protein [Lentisphaerota bacterium]
MKKIVALGMIALMAVTGFAALDEGTRELRLDGGMDFESGDGDVETAIDIGYGYFIAKDVELGALVSFIDDGSEYGYGIGGFGELNFDLNTIIVPYIGARMEYFDGDHFARSFVVLEGAAGVKIFLVENVAVSGELVADWATEDVYVNDNDADDTDVGIRLGIRAFI